MIVGISAIGTLVMADFDVANNANFGGESLQVLFRRALDNNFMHLPKFLDP